MNTQTTPLTCNEICWKMIVWIISLVIIVINVAVDTLTLILYFESEEYAFFALTLVFLSLPLLVIATASLIWLRDEDRRRDENTRAEDGQFTAASILLHVALLGLAYRLAHVAITYCKLCNQLDKLQHLFHYNQHFVASLSSCANYQSLMNCTSAVGCTSLMSCRIRVLVYP